MAEVIPFCAFRPVRDKVHLVASRSYVTYKPRDLRVKLDDNPFTFLHVINPEHTLKAGTKANSAARFRLVKTRFDQFVDEGIIKQDDQSSYYIYRQIKNGHHYIGIIACASVADYYNDVIKKHEATITKREKMFKNYLDYVAINAEPVCFTYPNNNTIDEITAQKMKHSPEYDFTTTNKVQHTFWVVSEPELVSNIQNEFSNIPAVYIADGHHRSASSALLGKEKRAKDKNGQLLTDYFMGIFIPESNLKIYEFNRLVTSIGDYTKETLISAIKNQFDVFPKGKVAYQPQQVHEISMYIDKEWYCLVPKEGTYDHSNPVEELDVSILSHNILEPILGIADLKTDPRILFMAGTEGLSKLQSEVDAKRAEVAFAHFPVTIEQLKAVADAQKIMPPKSTWIEPKLRSGLTVYSIEKKDQ